MSDRYEADDGMSVFVEGEYECRLNRAWLDEPLNKRDFDAGVPIRLTHTESDNSLHMRVYGHEYEPATMTIWLEENRQHFLCGDARQALVRCISLSTQPLVEWAE